MDVSEDKHITIVSMDIDVRRPTSSVMRQVIVSLVSSALSIVCGSSLSYSGIVVPQILDRENGTSFNVTSKELLWISSSTSLAIPIGVALAGFTMDAWGRLATLKLSVIPNVIGWTLIAAAQNGLMVIFGRMFTGISYGLSSGPAFVYISEVSDSKIRGALLCIPGIFFSIGILLTYFKGWLLHWRWVSWIFLIYSVISVIITLFLPESPSWLISKGRNIEAKKSLQWFRTVKDLGTKKSEDDELNELVEQHVQNVRHSTKTDLRVFLKPTCYKPFMIISVLFAFQQFSGLYVITLNSVIFFKDIRAAIDPYQASVYMGVLRLVVCLFGMWVTNKVGRRSLMMVSAGGMACCMIVSGLFTQWIYEGTTTQTWVPIFTTFIYFIFSSIGLQILPFAIASEIFPQSVRGVMQGLALTICYLLMFASLHSYGMLKEAFGGAPGLQYFFATMSLIAVVFIFLFVPETFRKTLSEIEAYFWHKVFYIK
ncbi:hypothetical protein RI129_013093 [Pyrocoelia pectoralis]|uniref:Major facilitator superfamily (MFS) profile domain-containing protein n=1 Tax=Pyrocoelia pectoralis TaxID=417401 RepID=A0AAN7ZGW8_9COLE